VFRALDDDPRVFRLVRGLRELATAIAASRPSDQPAAGKHEEGRYPQPGRGDRVRACGNQGRMIVPSMRPRPVERPRARMR
jgi:hypothetical protein